MSEAAQQTGSARRTNRRLLFAVFSAPIAWFVHEVVGVSVVGRTCESLTLGEWWVLGLVSGGAAAVALTGALMALSTFNKTARESIGTAEGHGRVEFLAQLGFFLNLLLLLNIVYFALVPLLVESCRTSV